MILVTGGTGLVGSHLLYNLISEGEKVRALHRKTSDLQAVLRVFKGYAKNADVLFKKIEWVEGDITNIPSLIKAFKDVAYVYHAAAFISFDTKHFEILKKVNIEGTANVVNLCLAHSIKKLCYVSSIATLGKEKEGVFITEKTEYNPDAKNSVYSITKFGGEIEVWRASQEGLDVAIVHPGVILGEGIWKSASGSILRSANKGIPFYTPGSVGIVDVKDVVKALVLLMKSTVSNDHFILVGKNILYKDLLSNIAKYIHKKPPQKKARKSFLILLSYLDGLSHNLFRTKRRVSKSTVDTLFEKVLYSSKKIETQLSFNFTSFEKTAERVCSAFLRES